MLSKSTTEVAPDEPSVAMFALRSLPALLSIALLLACAPALRGHETQAHRLSHVDTLGIPALARAHSSDAMEGRGPYSTGNLAAANMLATALGELGAQPLVGSRLLVPFVAPGNLRDTSFNVVGVIPGRRHSNSAELIGITSHLDHLGVGRPNAAGDSIYNGFLDAAVPVAMVMDVARRFAQAPGDRSLVVMFFNLEEQGLVGSRLFVARDDVQPVLARLRLLVGVDAGSPAGEAVEYQLMGTVPGHAGASLADSLARARGWTTTATAPRAISDVFAFSERGVPIVFPIPGKVWKGYTEQERTEAMARFDHYHQPSDEFRTDFPWRGTVTFADWLWSIVSAASDGSRSLSL
jgi:Zn-dependent M28 family amino/carboxypeptidase